MGYDWKIALMAVFAEGLIFIVLSLTNVREAIFNATYENIGEISLRKHFYASILRIFSTI